MWRLIIIDVSASEVCGRVDDRDWRDFDLNVSLGRSDRIVGRVS
jgi:hypothetical protein